MGLDFERTLLDLGAIKENDVRMKRRDSEENVKHQNGKSAAVEDDDDDWE